MPRPIATAHPGGLLDVYQNRRETEALGIEQPDVIQFLSPPTAGTPCGSTRSMIRACAPHIVQGRADDHAALLDVSSPQKKKICFLTGHGEMSPTT